VIAHLVNRTDVWMVQRGGRPRFTIEAPERYRVASQLFGKELQCNAAAQLKVFGFEYDSMPPPPSISSTR
jgi:hypothetical protein